MSKDAYHRIAVSIDDGACSVRFPLTSSVRWLLPIRTSAWDAASVH